MNKSLAAMNGALGSCSPLLLLFAAFRGNFLCPLRGSNSFLQMWGNLSAPGVAAHPCTKQGWEKWAYTESFYDFFFFAILSVPQQVSACPLIKRSTLANSVAAYYGNFMCTIHDLMQACYVNRKRLFHCTVIESYRGDVKTCWAALLHRNTNIYQQQRDAATFFFSASVSANSISLSCELIIPPFEMNELFGEQELLKTNISREPSFLFTITAPLKAIVKEFNSVNRTPSGYQNLKHFHKSWMKLLWSSPPPSPLKYNSAWNMKKGEASIRLYGSKCEEIKVDTR